MKDIIISYTSKEGFITTSAKELIEMKFKDKSKLDMVDKIISKGLMLKNDNDPILAAEEYVNLSFEHGYEMLLELGMPQKKAKIIYHAALLHFFMQLILNPDSEVFHEDLLDMLKDLL